jgi:hypothetical protein
MSKSGIFNRRRVALLVALGLGCALTAPAFARDHVSVNIGVAVPGVSVGYSNYHHYRGGYGYAGPAYYPAPVYYRPAPRVVYYDEPRVIEQPVYVERGYGYGRVIYHDGDHDRGRHRGWDRDHDRGHGRWRDRDDD